MGVARIPACSACSLKKFTTFSKEEEEEEEDKKIFLVKTAAFIQSNMFTKIIF